MFFLRGNSAPDGLRLLRKSLSLSLCVFLFYL